MTWAALGLAALAWGATHALLALHLRLAKSRGWGQPVREQGPAAHLAKEGTPTAAGWAFVPALLAAQPLAVPFALAAGGVGAADDAAKLSGRRAGVPARWRLLLQLALGGGIALSLPTLAPAVAVAWGLEGAALAAVFAVSFAAVVNGVNFTDGADGLLAAVLGGATAGVALVAASPLARPGSEETLSSLLPMVGALLAWWAVNRPPARAFMGETGSYLLGGWLFVAAMRDPLILLAVAAVPLFELASVVIQVASFRLTGRRVFRMAPFHHHLELSGWSERRLAAGAFSAQFAATAAILAIGGPG